MLNYHWKSLRNVTFSCPFWIFYVMYKKFLSFSSSNLWALLYSNLSLLTVSFPDSTSAQWGQWSGNKTVGQEHLVLVVSFPCRLSRDTNMYCGDRVYISTPAQLQSLCSWAWEPGSEAMVFVYCKQSCLTQMNRYYRCCCEILASFPCTIQFLTVGKNLSCNPCGMCVGFNGRY